MAKQTINIGASPNDGTGTPLRTAFDYTNQNFTELYTATGPSGNNIVVPGNATITGDLTVATDRLKVVTGSTAIQTGATTQLQVGTTSWPSTVIGKSGSRSLFGNTGEVAIWTEAAPAIGNYSTLFVTAKTGAGATTMGGLQIRAGIENASNSDGFVSLWTSNSAAGGFVERYKIDATGIATWSNVGGVAGTAMTLNSTGLGVGGSPNYKLNVTGPATSFAGSPSLALYDTTVGSPGSRNWLIGNVAANNYGELIFCVSSAAGGAPTNVKMTLDASGRLLVGSTSAFTDLTGSKEVKIGDGGIQTFSSAISAATPTNIARGGVGGLVYVGGFNGTGQYGAVVLWTTASATVVSEINGTGSTITFGVSGGFLQITSSLALTVVGANCIRL